MELLLPGFSAALILVGIHTYLGLHVITRGVIFVDLAMAQSAALGTIVGFIVYGQGSEHPIGYLFSLGFTLLCALLFALSRSKSKVIPDEAIIGLTYAILSSLTILLIDKAPHGTERIRGLLAGQVLWVSWFTVLKTMILYGIVGIVHYVWRDRFLLVSQTTEESTSKDPSRPLWDFLFYATFGVVVTSSVSIGGVLLVFTLLVAPALIGTLYGKSFLQRLMIGYAFGFVITVFGFLIAYFLDMPTGASIVATFGAALLPLGFVRFITHEPKKRGVRLALSLLIIAVPCSFMTIAWKLGPHSSGVHQHTLQTKNKQSLLNQGTKHPNTPSTPVEQGSASSQVAFSNRPNKRMDKHVHASLTKRLRKLLSIVEGKNERPLYEREQALGRLCKWTHEEYVNCVFSGELDQMDRWFKDRAFEIRKHLENKRTIEKQASSFLHLESSHK